jgi:hypothetical protein
MTDDRLDKQTVRTEHVSLTCVNHTNKRYSTKNISFRSLFFHGEVCEPVEFTHHDGTTEILTFKMSANMPSLTHLLKSRLNGVNPYDSNLTDEEPSIKTWDEVLEFVTWVDHVSKLCSFECDCPARDLVYLHEVAGHYTTQRHHGPVCRTNSADGACDHMSCFEANADRSVVNE